MSVIILLILLFMLLGIMVFIGVYVYRDAQKRGMNALLWLLIALLTPSLLGLIIYLLVRGSYSDLKCPNCQTTVEENYMVCPNCQTRLRASCPNCNTPVQPSWKVCPQCAEPLPENFDAVSAPVRPKDNTLWKILIAIIVIPVALIILLVVLSFSSFRTTVTSQSTAITAMPVDDYMALSHQPEAIKEWLSHCASSQEQYHVLKFSSTQGNYFDTQYLIYIPGAGEYTHSAHGYSTSFFSGPVLEIDLAGAENTGEQIVFLVLCSGDEQPEEKLKLTFNGKTKDLCVTSTDEPIQPIDE